MVYSNITLRPLALALADNPVLFHPRTPFALVVHPHIVNPFSSSASSRCPGSRCLASSSLSVIPSLWLGS